MRRSTRIAGVISIASLLIGLITMTPAASASTTDPITTDVYGNLPYTPEYNIDIDQAIWLFSNPLIFPAGTWTPIPVPQVPDRIEKPREPELSCDNVHVKRLYKTGFRGKNLVEAWAVLMRESGGRPDAISATGDYGVFQFNKAAHSRQDWWDTDKMLTWEYNMKIAYEISDGGRTWYPWDIDGRGDHLGRYTSSGTYGKFREWYDKFPCEITFKV